MSIEVLNHALDGLPEDRIRYHLCWGSWHGPHANDVPLAHIADIMLRVNAGAYLIEAANSRHEHEYHLWEDLKLPDGKILIPGVVTHSTNIVEHPELVAERITRYADRLGAGNVIAGADCGFGSRIHPELGWAKLSALVEGAALASSRIWKALPGPWRGGLRAGLPPKSQIRKLNHNCPITRLLTTSHVAELSGLAQMRRRLCLARTLALRLEHPHPPRERLVRPQHSPTAAAPFHRKHPNARTRPSTMRRPLSQGVECHPRLEVVCGESRPAAHGYLTSN
jgi:hypothetical protein